ncbi:hypothetical protein TNCV_1950451 [Trichonephila clavipes]|nr:hypothetical protein TNCV_1950451 [Trichonephila clavipes]
MPYKQTPENKMKLQLLIYFLLTSDKMDCRGSLVAEVTDSWPACQEFELSAAEDPPCREAMHFKSVESSNVLLLMWCGS